MKKPKLVLHIGHSKCGSSSIQTTLSKNRDWLTAQGIHFLNADVIELSERDHLTNGLEYFVKILQCHQAGELEQARQKVRDLIDRLHEKAAANQLHTFVLSYENMPHAAHARLFEAYRDTLDIQIIYYVRRQDEWLISGWKQWGIKANYSLDEYIDFMLAQDAPNFDEIARAWEHCYGPENCHINILSKNALRNGDLIEDFFHAIGHSRPPLIADQVNVSYDYAILHLLRESHYQFKNAHDISLDLFLRHYPELTARGKLELLGKKRREQIMAHFEAGNRRLWSRAFPSTPFEALFGTDRYPEHSQRPTDVEALMKTSMMQFEILQKQHEEIAKLKSSLKKLQATQRKKTPPTQKKSWKTRLSRLLGK